MKCSEESCGSVEHSGVDAGISTVKLGRRRPKSAYLGGDDPAVGIGTASDTFLDNGLVLGIKNQNVAVDEYSSGRHAEIASD